MDFEIVSREDELASIHAFIGGAEGEPGALVLEGEAGIGKSTLWLAGVEHARARGVHVLVSRPAEAERGLAHVGLGDLFEDVLDEVLPALSAPRRRALEIALLLEEATADAVDPRALGILQPLPVPETLDELVRGKILGLPEPTRQALALASAFGTPSEALLERAGVAPDALAPRSLPM
jgi:hypothetical protein